LTCFKAKHNHNFIEQYIE